MASSQVSAPTDSQTQAVAFNEYMTSAVARRDPVEHRKELEAQLNHPEYATASAEFAEMLRGLQAKTGGESIASALQQQGEISADNMMKLMPAEMFGKAAEAFGVPEDELTKGLEETFSVVADMAKQMQAFAAKAGSQPGDARPPLGRAQTMGPNATEADLKNFEFKDINELIGSFPGLKLGDGGDNQPDFEKLFAQAQEFQSTVVKVRGTPVADSATAFEHIAAFHKEVNAFIATYRKKPADTEEDRAKHGEQLMIDFQVARSQSVILTFGRSETLTDVQQGISGFQAVLNEMARIAIDADTSGIGSSIQTLSKPDVGTEAALMTPDELQGKIDEAVKIVIDAVEKHSEAEAAHREAELAKLAEDVD